MNSKKIPIETIFKKDKIKEFEDIFKINTANILSSNFYHRKTIIKISTDRTLSIRSAYWVLKS